MEINFNDPRSAESPVSNVVELRSAVRPRPTSFQLNSITTPGIGALELPAGFTAFEDGIYCIEEDEDGNENPVRICSMINVVGLCRREDNTSWGRVVDVIDPDNKTHRVIVEEATLAGSPSALLRPLVQLGLKIEARTAAKKQVAELLGAWRPQMRFVRVGSLGWIGNTFDAFALADGAVVGEKLIVLEQDLSVTGKAMHARGSIEEWRNLVAAPCVGNALMIFALSQAFAGPLLAPMVMDGGGFHLRGASSRGKSTLLGLAASVWGSPAFVQSWRATDNALEALASCCNDALLVLDELHQVDPKVVGEAVYMLANGRGKQRMSSGGRAASQESWHVAVLSSGEISLEEHMASGNKKIHAGQEIRLLDIGADGRTHGAFDDLHDAKDARSFAEQLKRAASSNYGLAGKHFIERLLNNIDQTDALRKMMDRFVETANSRFDLSEEGQVQRALKRFALVACAGELATKFGLTGWPVGAANSAVFEVLRSWLEDRDTARLSEVNAALTLTRNYVTRNAERFGAIGSTSIADGWLDGSWFYILPDVWAEIHGADSVQNAARLHKVAGVLQSSKGAGLQHRMGRATQDRPRVYAVSSAILKI